MAESAAIPTTLDTNANITNPLVYPPAEYPGVKFVATDAPNTYTSNGTVLIPEGGGGGIAEPADQIAFGTGAGLTSSSAFNYNPTTFFFSVADLNDLPILDVQGTVTASRLVAVKDEGGHGILSMFAAAAARTMILFDEGGAPIISWFAKIATRTIEMFDSAGHQLETWQTAAAMRSVTQVDETGAQVTSTSLIAASAGETFGSPGSPHVHVDVHGGQVVGLNAANANTFVLDEATGEVFPGEYTVAFLPAVANGAWLYASNGRKIGEGPGAGTGVMVYGSNAAWRVPSTDAAVTA